MYTSDISYEQATFSLFGLCRSLENLDRTKSKPIDMRAGPVWSAGEVKFR